jgi:hypothetical protein
LGWQSKPEVRQTEVVILRPEPRQSGPIEVIDGDTVASRAWCIGSRDVRRQLAAVSLGYATSKVYWVRCASIASQAFSASANVLNGDPPTLMAGRLKWMGRQEAT